MIHYQLVCRQEHAFDGWFRDSGAFDRQAKAGLVECPECGSAEVNRALMAPSIGRSRGLKKPVMDQAGRMESGPAESGSVESGPVESGRVKTGVVDGAGGAVGAPEKAVMPDQVRAVLQRLRAEVEKNCEHVGERFADEARAIHRGETAARGIYGESTREQAEALAEEGIQVSRVPWVPRADG